MQTDDSNVPSGYDVWDQRKWKSKFQTKNYPIRLLVTFETGVFV